MSRSRLLTFTVLAWVFSAESLLFAQKQWIRPGSFIDWPETLRIEEFGNTDSPRMPVAPPQRGTVLPEGHSLASLERTETVTEVLPPAQDGFPHSLAGDPFPFDELGLDQIGCETVSTDGWQLLPPGLLYRSYLAGEKEPRFAAQWLWERDRGLIWETAMGGRFGLIRYGTLGAVDPSGFQLDVEGAAFTRIDPEEGWDLEAVDFRVGVVGTWREGPWRFKTGYYHISSHVGDEFLIRFPDFDRLNYVRDAWLIGLMYDITPDLQIYGEFAYAFNANGGAEPGEFQFGMQYTPAGPSGPGGAPFAAINGHLRQEHNFGGSVNVVAGWQWRGRRTDRLFRLGMMHYSGPSIQWSFPHRYESLTGVGIWFDF